mgnify:FL=1|tara:strand:- start:423 stop:650 length:228 start_codon:yes stop_codon:yes gene_type:complete
MKIKVSYTIDVDPKLVQFYLDDLESGETVREFVKSYCESVAYGCLEETLSLFESHATGGLYLIKNSDGLFREDNK